MKSVLLFLSTTNKILMQNIGVSSEANTLRYFQKDTKKIPLRF